MSPPHPADYSFMEEFDDTCRDGIDNNLGCEIEEKCRAL
jgi:hypothetical protein